MLKGRLIFVPVSLWIYSLHLQVIKENLALNHKTTKVQPTTQDWLKSQLFYLPITIFHSI